jgi:hypothetical protein
MPLPSIHVLKFREIKGEDLFSNDLIGIWWKLSYVKSSHRLFEEESESSPSPVCSIVKTPFFWKGAHFEERIRFFGKPITVCVKPLGLPRFLIIRGRTITDSQGCLSLSNRVSSCSVVSPETCQFSCNHM